MLKNIAIPLMLAASEAEAQNGRKPTKEDIEDALEADRAKVFKGLQADAAACSVEADATVADRAQDVSDAKGRLELANKAVEALKDLDGQGAWAVANQAREQAVAAAEAEEAGENIAGLLDTLDEKAEAERAKAALYLEADKAFRVGELLAAAAKERNDDAIAEEKRLSDANTAAADALQAAKDQLAKEVLWRRYRYCELGAAVVGAALTDPNNEWWQMVQDSYTASQPKSCLVAAVDDGTPVDGDNDANTPDAPTEVRGAVTYFFAKTDGNDQQLVDGTDFLSAETDDGTKRWTATLVHTSATAAESATTTPALQGGIARTAAGLVAWHTGDLRAKTWVHMMRTRESAYYRAINTSRAAAKGAADNTQTDTWVVTADALTTLVDSGLGVAADADNNVVATDGPATNEKAKRTLRDASGHAAPGSGYVLAADRTQDSNAAAEDNGWQMTWAIDQTSMTNWATANASNKGPAYLWWEKAELLGDALATWYTAWYDNLDTPQADDAQRTGALQMTAGGANISELVGAADFSCDVSGGAQWTDGTGTDNDSKDNCKAACFTATSNALLVNKDTANPTVDNGGLTLPAYDGAGTGWCGAYSYNALLNNHADAKCKLLLNTAWDAANNNGADPVVASGSNTANTDECGKATNTKGWSDKQAAVKGAWDAFTAQDANDNNSTLHTRLVAAVDVQAGLEKNWLEAWYNQAYWGAIVLELTCTDPGNNQQHVCTAGSMAKTTYDALFTVDAADSGDQTTVAGAETMKTTAENDLNTAEEALAKLQATTAEAAATVAALGKRILNADAQIAELTTLTTDGALATTAVLRETEWNAYKNDGSVQDSVKGEFTLAQEALDAADAAVKPRSDSNATDGGDLTEDRALAQAAWDTAQGEASDAEGFVTAALTGAALATLRKQVEDDTATWNQQALVLAGLVADVVNAEKELKEAEDAKDAAVLACQIAAFDKYRTTLEGEMVQRIEDLKTIKALVETELEKPAPGTAGARCEKALSNGTYRPARGEQVCDENLCCGAARVWMTSGATADAAWRTIETCQLATDTEYEYQPPRAPMATTMPAKQKVAFTCIEGAKKLAAAASAVAAAVYMLA